MSDHDRPQPRVAIKFGSSTGDSKHHSRGRPKPASSLGKRHRAHTLHDDLHDDSDSGDDDRGADGRHEVITDYGPDGAVFDRKRRDRDRSPSFERGSSSRRSPRDSRSRKGDRRGERRGQTQRNGPIKEVEPADADKPIQWGLTINRKPKQSGGDGRAPTQDGSQRNGGGDDKADSEAPKTADEEAMDALLSERKERRRQGISTDLDRDPLPEDYESVPIEEFGATLLRGFGWDGKMRGKVKDVTKRSNLVGLGAKDLKGAEDLDAWTQKSGKSKDSDRKPRPTRLDDYRREEEKKRQRREDKYGDSYRREKERDRDRGRDRDEDRHRHRDRR